MFVLFPQYYVDRTRQRLFDLRDRLFIDAVNDEIPLDSRAHRMTRGLINASIRFAHDLCLTRLIVSKFRSNKNPTSLIRKFQKEYNEALNELTTEQRAYISGINSEWTGILNSHVISVSWLMQSLREIFFLGARIFHTTAKVSQLIEENFRSIRDEEIIEDVIEHDLQELRLAA